MCSPPDEDLKETLFSSYKLMHGHQMECLHECQVTIIMNERCPSMHGSNYALYASALSKLFHSSTIVSIFDVFSLSYSSCDYNYIPLVFLSSFIILFRSILFSTTSLTYVVFLHLLSYSVSYLSLKWMLVELGLNQPLPHALGGPIGSMLW